MYRLKFLVIPSSLFLLTACQSVPDPELSSLEAVLNNSTLNGKTGTGWQCFPSPDGSKQAGFVFVRGSGEVLRPAYDERNTATEFGIAIGVSNFTIETKLGGALTILEDAGSIDAGATATASRDRTYKQNVTLAGERKQLLLEPDFRRIVERIDEAPDGGPAEYFIVIESVTVTGMNYVWDENFISEIGITAELDEAVSVDPKFRRVQNGSYQLSRSFEEPLGVCTLATSVSVGPGLTGGKRLDVAGYDKTVQLPE